MGHQLDIFRLCITGISIKQKILDILQGQHDFFKVPNVYFKSSANSIKTNSLITTHIGIPYYDKRYTAQGTRHRVQGAFCTSHV